RTRTAVRHHNGRRMVDVAQMDPDGIPSLLVFLAELCADGVARRVTLRRRRFDFSTLGRTDETAVVLQRNLRRAGRGRAALVVVAVEQRLTAPPVEHGGK